MDDVVCLGPTYFNGREECEHSVDFLVLSIFDVLFAAVARFDFSWGDEAYHQETLDNLKTAVKNTRRLCAVCLWPPSQSSDTS